MTFTQIYKINMGGRGVQGEGQQNNYIMAIFQCNFLMLHIFTYFISKTKVSEKKMK